MHGVLALGGGERVVYGLSSGPMPIQAGHEDIVGWLGVHTPTREDSVWIVRGWRVERERFLPYILASIYSWHLYNGKRHKAVRAHYVLDVACDYRCCKNGTVHNCLFWNCCFWICFTDSLEKSISHSVIAHFGGFVVFICRHIPDVSSPFKDNVRCTAVDQQLGQLKAKAVQLS